MRSFERLIVYPALAAAIGLSAFAALAPRREAVRWLAEPVAYSGRGEADPDAAKVAVCDVYKVIDKLVETDRFKPARTAEEERVNAVLKPMRDELEALETALRGADPKDEQAQAKYREWQEMRQRFEQQRGQLEREFRVFMGKQFVEAFGLIKASADGVAESLGYSYVIISRALDEEIKTDEPSRLIESVLARPVIKHPKEADITDDVIEDLKLD